MIDIGRICVKISGRDANKKCVIVEIYDDNYVLIDGETRRRKCNVRHLEPLEKTIKISSGANHADIEKEFKKEPVEITIVSDANYYLFTPMLPQVASGLLHPSNITIPVRYFCKKAKFLQASIESIDLDQRLVTIQRSFDSKVHTLEYDYLVIALGGQTNYFGNNNKSGEKPLLLA